MKTSTLQDLLIDEIRDLYDAEKQLIRAIPKMAKASSDSELGDAFRQHLEQTKEQASRLEQVFESMGMKAKSKPCRAMKGLVEEGQEVMGEEMEDALMDCALVGAARRVEHYEMAGYDSARAMAQALGLKDAMQLLQETLNEETQTDKRLTQIGKRLLKEAGRPQPAKEPEGKAQTKSSGGGSKKAASAKRSGSKRSSSKAGGSGPPTTDHEEIKRWAEERGAHPACVRGTGNKGDIGMIRLDFPGYSGADSLEEISWDEFFEKFDENGLALIYQEKTAAGEKSNFNKLVKRETVQSGKSRA